MKILFFSLWGMVQKDKCWQLIILNMVSTSAFMLENMKGNLQSEFYCKSTSWRNIDDTLPIILDIVHGLEFLQTHWCGNSVDFENTVWKKNKALNVQKTHVHCNTQFAETLSLVRSHNLKHTKATNLLHCAYSDM
jgi:hypothetical protein